LKRGELQGEKEEIPQGFVWRVELPADALPSPPDSSATVDPTADAVELAQLRERAAGLERLADELQSERDAWREQAQRDGDAARELRVLLRNEQMRALPLETTHSEASGAPDMLAHHDVHLGGQAPPRRGFWDWLRGK